MKKFVLAAIAALTLGVATASAAPVTNQLGQTVFGPAYNSDSVGGA